MDGEVLPSTPSSSSNGNNQWTPQWVEVWPNELWRADLPPTDARCKTKFAASAYVFSSAQKMLSNERMNFFAPQSSRAWTERSEPGKQWAVVTAADGKVQLRQVRPRKLTKPGANQSPLRSSRTTTSESSEMSDWDSEDSTTGNEVVTRNAERIATLEAQVAHLLALVQNLQLAPK
jgi:hypothetical protein